MPVLCSFNLFLFEGASLGASEPKVWSSVDTRWIPGGSLVDPLESSLRVATFFYAPCLRREHIFKFERTSAPNIPTMAPHLTIFMSTFPLHPFFSSFFKNVLPAHVGSMILKIDPQHFASKTPHFGPMMPLISNGWSHRFLSFSLLVAFGFLFSPHVGYLGGS